MSDLTQVSSIETRIQTIRAVQVIIDTDLAQLYGVETKVLNQAVKRNIARFPQQFRFQLNPIEKNELVTNCDRFGNLKHSTTLPYAFTEQGVAMLSAVLRSETAVRTSIQIIDAFVKMRQFLAHLLLCKGCSDLMIAIDSKLNKVIAENLTKINLDRGNII